ncbi:MAG TPA: hypothetical protein PLM32_05565 [Candidatus Competibacter sp.]|nr:hypothetical protein [Candidatus Competibacter sp.]
MDMRELPGIGAAGNLSAGLKAFPGTDLVAMTADRIDSQTAFGKVPAGEERTHTLGMPCFAIADGKGRWVG